MKKIDLKTAKRIGNEIGINWSEVNLVQFTMGMNEELEHGKKDPQTNVTNDNLTITGKIAFAHLKEDPNYYSKLKKVMGENLSIYKIYKDLILKRK
jgi:hypothetical protein